jgi:hypothetical protein
VVEPEEEAPKMIKVWQVSSPAILYSHRPPEGQQKLAPLVELVFIAVKCSALPRMGLRISLVAGRLGGGPADPR